MNLEELRKRLGEIVAQLETFQNAESFSDEDLESINALNEEYEQLAKNIEAMEKLEKIKAASTTSTRRVAPSSPEAAANTSKVTVVGNKKEDTYFGDPYAGENLMAIKDVAYGKVDPRMERLMNSSSHNESVGADGGFLVPADMRSDIQRKVMGDDSLLPRTRQYKTSSNRLELPINEVAPWEGTGIQAYWEGEEQEHTLSKTKFGLSEWKLHKLTAFVKVTDELLEDAPAIESYIRQEAPDAIVHKINSAIISGDGVGKLTGFLNSTFKFKVSKQGGQAADTVLFENVNNMLGRLLPASFGRAFWLVNPAVLPTLRLMKFDSAAASPVPVYLPGNSVAGAPHGTLFGLPIVVKMGGVKALGDEGDISLVDLSYYYSVMKTTSYKAEINPYLYWDKDIKAMKFQIRMGGHCPFKAPVKTEFGDYSMSAFVTLEDRA